MWSFSLSLKTDLITEVAGYEVTKGWGACTQ